MNHNSEIDLVDYRRGALSAIVAMLSTLFNYSNAVETSTDIVLWFVFFTVGTYLVFTALSMLSARIWG